MTILTKNQKKLYKHKTTDRHGLTLTNGIYSNLTPLTVDKCKKGLIVLTKAGSIFKIEQIWQNKNRADDLTVEVGNGEFGNLYGSYLGVFQSLKISEQ